MKDKMYQLNIRLNEKSFERLNKISDESGRSPGSMGSNIVNQWLDLYHCKMCRGDVIFSQPVLRRLMDALDKSQINEISEFMANHIVKEIRMQEGDVGYQSLVEHILKWNKANHLPLNRISKKNRHDKTNFGHAANEDDDESDMFVSRHTLGRNWSELECKTYMKIFEIISMTVISSNYDDDTFSFEVIKKRSLAN